MAISLDELRNGFAVEQDLVFPSRPDDPAVRESASFWMFDDTGLFGFPRLGIEAEAASWDSRPFQANFAFADGRILNGAGRGPALLPIDAQGRPTILNGGAVTFRCMEPFRRWAISFDGPAVDSHVSQQIARTVDPQKKIPVRLEAEATMVTPAWGQLHDEKDATLSTTFMGLGYRYEHLFRAEGVLHVDGKARPFKGTGLRIHRQSKRSLEGFVGHCWQSAVFPDGRAFGYIIYPPNADGTETYNDGYIYQNGRMYPAKCVKAPWLRRIVGTGDDVSLELESELGRTRIEGSTTLSTFRVGNPDMGGLNLQQSGVLYTWDGQSAYGMIERSAHESLTTIG